jgi:hypothetical protein
MRPALALFLLVLPTAAAAAENPKYLCIADQSNGFKYDKALRAWRPAQFDVEGKRYIVKQSGNFIRWDAFGGDPALGSVCMEFQNSGLFTCDGMQRITFSNKSLRYMLVYEIGYVKDSMQAAEVGDTPYIEIGTCSPL